MHGPGLAVAPFYNLLLAGRVELALSRLATARAAAMREGEWELVGLLSELTSEAHYVRGEYALALDWHRQAAELAPELAERGRNSITAILLDQGELEQAEAYGRSHVAALAAAGDTWGLPYAHTQLGSVLVALGRLDEAEAQYREALRRSEAPGSELFYTVLARAYLALLHGARGDAVAYRRLGETALAQARGRSLYLQAIVAIILYPALRVWHQPDAALALLQEAMPTLAEVGARWLLHIGHLHLARDAHERGDTAASRAHLAQALAPASQEGYVQYLYSQRRWTLPLLAEAIRGGSEVAFCQELFVRTGSEALPVLRELLLSPEPGARQAALYPLAAIGGEQAVALVRHALYDADPVVRDAALLAYRHLCQHAPDPEGSPVPPANPAPAPAAPARVNTTAAGAAPGIQITCLGGLQVRVGGQEVRLRTQKARDLLAYLVTYRGQPASKERLLEALWPEGDPGALQDLFHTTVYQLRRALKGAGQDVVAFSGGLYRLNQAAVWVDTDQFLELAAGQDPQGWAAAVQLYGGDLFGEADYPWCQGQRTHFREVYLQLLRRLGKYEEERGAPEQAVLWWQRLLEADPLGEEPHLALMACYARSGRRSAAVQQYRTLVRTLQRELGVPPSQSAQALAKRLLS